MSDNRALIAEGRSASEWGFCTPACPRGEHEHALSLTARLVVALAQSERERDEAQAEAKRYRAKYRHEFTENVCITQKLTEQAATIEAVGVDIAKVIADLDRARANGTTYTYGNIQERLRHTSRILSGREGTR